MTDPTTESATPVMPEGTYIAGNFSFANVTVSEDWAEDFEIVARMTNNGGDIEYAHFTATLFSGENIVGTAWTIVRDVAAGATITVELLSTDEYVTWDSLEFQVDRYN